ncbi:MAG: GTPase Era [Clostridia bacterium]|nr:GTPase Era [Clostridia bacterium]
MFKSGFVTIIGKPNVGKSTLLNSLIGEKVSIVSPKPQTTRNNITGIKNGEYYQIVFLDTPGMLKPKNKLDDYMLQSINSALSGIDIIVYMLDATKLFRDDELQVIQNYAKSAGKLILVVNKTDETNFEALYPKLDKLNKLEGIVEIVPLSALRHKNVDVLLNAILKLLPEGVKYYPDDIHTDKSERFLVSEIIREKALWHLQEEIPHGIAIEIERFEEKEKIIQIDAVIICEKASHKNIIIGKGGSMLKLIGRNARLDIQNLLQSKVFLNIFVKVKDKWRNSDLQINTLGYDKKEI